MKCENCGTENTRSFFDKVEKKWFGRCCTSVQIGFTSPAYLHQSACNPDAPKLSIAKNNVFTRSRLLKSGEVIDTATGKEAAY